MSLLAVAVADYVGLVLTGALLISSHIRRASPKEEYQIFSFIAVMSAIACGVDFLCFYVNGRPGNLAHYVNVVGNAFCFMLNPVFAVLWCIYTEFKLYDSRKRVIRIYRIVAIPAIIMILAAILNVYVPIAFYIDEANVYHRLPFSYAYYVVEAMYIIYSIIVVKQYEARYEKKRFFIVYLMIGPVVLGCVLQIIFYGVSLMWVSLAIGLTSVYMCMQNEFSYLDPLTGLYNRAYLDYQFEKNRAHGKHLGGIMIDVDYFKEINDTLGHHAGDEALMDVARIILLSKPDKATAMRFAGDEFILLIKDCNEDFLIRTIENIREELDLFNDTEGRRYKLSLSMGYALYDYSKDTEDSFFKNMDSKMYEEKKLKHAER